MWPNWSTRRSFAEPQHRNQSIRGEADCWIWGRPINFIYLPHMSDGLFLLILTLRKCKTAQKFRFVEFFLELIVLPILQIHFCFWDFGMPHLTPFTGRFRKMVFWHPLKGCLLHYPAWIWNWGQPSHIYWNRAPLCMIPLQISYAHD